ncbi:uracil-DNA glycosylase, partial [Mycoplasmopsis synoviae]
MKNSFLMVLQSEGKKPYFKNILSELERIGKDEVIYPAPPDIFAVFSDFELYETNLIFLDQDPYPNGDANGYAFSSNS